MRQILVAYIVSVLANRIFNWLWWWGRNRKAGVLGYFTEHGPVLLATLVLHVFVFPLWKIGALLPALNGVLKGADFIGAGVSIGPFEEVDPNVTLACGWIIDSITSRAGMLLGSRFAIFGSGTTPEPPKEKT